MRTVPLEERLWPKVDKTESCWLWTANLNNMGYGTIYLCAGRRKELAHRVVYELLVGPIPAGLELDHLCSTPRCVNPDHLEPVTHRENLARSRAARKTECNYGHDWTDPHNVYVRHDGRRWCAACSRERWKRAA